MSKWGHVVGGGICDLVVEAESQPEAAFGGQWVAIAADAGVGWHWDGAAWAQAPTPVDPAEWLIDIGPFMDRFGPAKLAVLASADATVRALVTDILARKWIDLQRADVAAGIDLLIAAGVSGVDAALKASILTTPVTRLEQLALRRLYF